VVDEHEFNFLPQDKAVREKYIHDKLQSNFSEKEDKQSVVVG